MEFGRGGFNGEGPAMSLVEISRVLEETARLVRQHAEQSPKQDARSILIGSREVRAVLAMRGLRREYFGFMLSDAAWAMMLELYATRLEGRMVHQTQLGILASIPQTTALATARRLIAKGVFVSIPHPEDKRLVVIGLSDQTADRLARYMTAAYKVSPLLA